MNYQIVPLGAYGEFVLNGVRFNGKSFMYWKKNNTTNIREVIVIFDKKYENVEVRDGVMVLSLKGLNNYQDLINSVSILLQILNANQINIQLHFVVDNENHKQVAEALGRNFGVSYVVQDVNQNREQQLQTMEEQLKKNPDLTAGGSQMIDTSNKKINIHDGSGYENNGLLNSEEEKVSLLREWMQDPVKAEELTRMSEKARNDLLTRIVLAGRKQHRLENASQQLASDKAGEVAISVAKQDGGLVNTQLNIVQHTDSRLNQYSAVERSGDSVQVVNPSVINAQISTGGLSGGSIAGGSGDLFHNYEEPTMEGKEIQQREVESQVFYIDENNYLLDSNGQVIEKLGNGVYDIDYDTNSITKNGKIAGSIGDYKDMGKADTYNKSNVRVLRKLPDDNKSAAFISFPVIMFVLSTLLLIGSVLLLFVLD